MGLINLAGGYEMQRKKSWVELGINSEEGRSATLLGASGGLMDLKGDGVTTSIFNPVLSEIFYRNYTRINDTILDPFCGGSVRGIQAGMMRRYYIGIDVRQEQVRANEEQRSKVMRSDWQL